MIAAAFSSRARAALRNLTLRALVRSLSCAELATWMEWVRSETLTGRYTQERGLARAREMCGGRALPDERLLEVVQTLERVRSKASMLAVLERVPELEPHERAPWLALYGYVTACHECGRLVDRKERCAVDSRGHILCARCGVSTRGRRPISEEPRA